MDSNSLEAWHQFLDPDVPRRRLIAASVNVASFEFLKDFVVERVRSFFANVQSGAGSEIDPEYMKSVRGLNKSVVYASLYWLQGQGAFDENDIVIFTRVRNLRNTLAHERFSQFLERGSPDEYNERFAEMVHLLNKIEVWWIREVYPPFDWRDVDDAEIEPGPVLGAQLLREIALGDAEESTADLTALKRLGRSGTCHLRVAHQHSSVEA